MPTAGRRLTPDEAVERMRKDIEIELVRDHDELTAFNVYYSSRDPHVAQKVTSELTNLFISENLEMRQRQSEDTTKFLESQLEGARKILAEQEAKIRYSKISIRASCRPSCKAILPFWVASNLNCRVKKTL